MHLYIFNCTIYSTILHLLTEFTTITTIIIIIIVIIIIIIIIIVIVVWLDYTHWPCTMLFTCL
jgi:hypothetical protein